MKRRNILVKQIIKYQIMQSNYKKNVTNKFCSDVL